MFSPPSLRSPARISVLASGGGSNLQALIDHFAGPAATAGAITFVASDQEGAGALGRARAAGIATGVIYAPRDSDAIRSLLDTAKTDVLVLAGYLKLIPDGVVRAFVVLNEAVARAAADASAARYKQGRALSSIDGMPIGIKDLIETMDMPTQMGCGAFTGNFPKRDSIMVRALRDAGAVIIGKTVTAELGMAHPGPTTNPFDPRRTPGGSSSGSAAT
jgi:hypothetical protein